MDAQTPISNGQAGEGRVADALQEESTVGYRPTLPLESLWVTGSDMPQITLRRDLEFMQMHPIVITALEYYKSGIAGAEFWGGPDHVNPDNEKGKPISADPRVAEFVMAHVERFWQRGIPMIQEGGYPYGWSPGEHIYKEVNGMLVWSHMKTFHPSDAHMLTFNYEPVGIRIRNIRGRGNPVDLWLSADTIPSKACWYAHRPRFSHYYGRSQLIGAWRPWRRLGWRDCLEQTIDAATYRAGYCGPIVRYPPGHSAGTAQQGVPATRVDGHGTPRRENRDMARQMCEWAKSGASFAISSEQYPQAQGGGPKWEVIWPEHVMDVRPLIDAARALEDHIILGIGVPPELIRAGGTGSGYSGRSIPREAFLDGQQKVADAMLQMFVEHVIKPLVLWNFGDVPFEVSCKSLLKSQSDDKQGEDEGNQQGDNGGAQQPAPAEAEQLPSAEPQQAAMSLEPGSRDKVLDIVRRVLHHSTVLSIDKGGREHKGKGEGGGQFVSKGKGGTKKEQPKTKQPKSIPDSITEISHEQEDETPYNPEYAMEAHKTGTTVYQLPPNIVKIRKRFEKKYKYGKDKSVTSGTWPVLAGLRPMTLIDCNNATDRNKGTIAEDLVKVIDAFGSEDVHVDQFDDKNYPGNKFLLVSNKKVAEERGLTGYQDLLKYWSTPGPNNKNMERLTGKWLGFPDESIEAYIKYTEENGMYMSTDEQGLEHKGKGEGGGQFVKKGGGGSSTKSGIASKPTKTRNRGWGARLQSLVGITPPDKPETEAEVAPKHIIGKVIPAAPPPHEKGVVHKSKVDPPADAGQPATREEHVAAINRAVSKAKLAPAPTEDEVRENMEGIERLGVNMYRKNLAGNSKDRRSRRNKLMKEFGNGTSCPCIYCGIKVGEGSLEQDKIVTTAHGGRYRISNLLPSCSSCNKRRGDKPFDEAIEKAVEYAREFEESTT